MIMCSFIFLFILLVFAPLSHSVQTVPTLNKKGNDRRVPRDPGSNILLQRNTWGGLSGEFAGQVESLLLKKTCSYNVECKHTCAPVLLTVLPAPTVIVNATMLVLLLVCASACQHAPTLSPALWCPVRHLIGSSLLVYVRLHVHLRRSATEVLGGLR